MEYTEYIYALDYTDGNAYKFALPKDIVDIKRFIESKGLKESNVCFMITTNNIDKFIDLDEE